MSSIKKSQLKKLTKMVLKEISFPEQPSQSEQQPKSIMGMLLKKLADTQAKHPAYNNIETAYKISNTILAEITKNIKLIIQSTNKKDSKSFNTNSENLKRNLEDLYQLYTIWTINAGNKSIEKRKDLLDASEKFHNHLKQMMGQLDSIIENIRMYENYINAFKQLKHFVEIFNEVKNSINNMFEVGLSVGLGKKNN